MNREEIMEALHEHADKTNRLSTMIFSNVASAVEQEAAVIKHHAQHCHLMAEMRKLIEIELEVSQETKAE